MTPPPLTKRRRGGELYRRPAEIEAKLVRVLEMSREEVAEALRIRDPGKPGYVPTECLVHLVRGMRRDNRGHYFELLYKSLADRIDGALPRAEHSMAKGVGVDISRARIREQVRDIFQEMLLEDWTEPGGRLDFFEVRFAAGLASLRATVKKKVWREAGRQEVLEPEYGTGEMSVEVERAAGSLDAQPDEIWDDPRYRKSLEAAIDALPPDQSTVMVMLKAGIPMSSTDPEAVTIQKILDCNEKTVRNRRDAAVRALRRSLGLED